MAYNISVVIPVYKSEGCLQELYRRLVEFLEKNSGQFEIIMVEDGGGDRCWEIIRGMAETDKRLNGIRLIRNFGQHNALLCGIRAARHEIIVTLDDDLQHPPEEIPKLLDKLSEGYDVVYGIPQRKQHGLWRNIASQTAKIAMQKAMGVRMASNITAFRAFRTQLRNAFVDYRGPFVSIDALLSWGTKRFTIVSVEHNVRRSGKSNYTFYKLLTHALDTIIDFTALPLRLASLVGLVFILFGLSVLVYVIGVYLIQGHSVPGFPFLASIIAIFSGAQLFALGIIGEYLARMHFRIMDRPPYVIREMVCKDTAQKTMRV